MTFKILLRKFEEDKLHRVIYIIKGEPFIDNCQYFLIGSKVVKIEKLKHVAHATTLEN